MTDTNGLIRAAGRPRPKDDLVARLKDDAVPSGGRWQLRREAAAEIERLRAENARLKQTFNDEYVDWAWRFKLNDVTAWDWMTRAERAEAERDLLLDEIEALDLPVPFGPENGRAWYEAVQESLDALRAERDTIRKINNGWAMDASKLEEERDALKAWLDNNMTHYNTAEAGAKPILAEFGKRVWYHVTDDAESFPFSAAIDAAREKP